jgi:peptidoglycan/LPS O-acetylase OafA/YrhL
MPTYSYGIYLGHSFFIWFALTRHTSWTLFWLMWLIIPVVLYHGFERPAIELGRRLVERIWAAPLPAPSEENLSAQSLI